MPLPKPQQSKEALPEASSEGTVDDEKTAKKMNKLKRHKKKKSKRAKKNVQSSGMYMYTCRSEVTPQQIKLKYHKMII